MQANPVVLCDANVLYGQWLRDLVMWLGTVALVRPRWTERIEQEWVGNLLEHRPDLDAARVHRTAQLMNQVLPEAKVPTPHDAPLLTLPDPDDVHVLQAALAAEATYLLTFNLADFPEDVCRRVGIEVLHPDAFLVLLHQAQPEMVQQTLVRLQRQKVRPPLSWQELAQAFERAGLAQFSRLLLDHPPDT